MDLLDHVEEVAAEAGQAVDELRADIEDMAATFDCMIRRVLGVGRRADV